MPETTIESAIQAYFVRHTIDPLHGVLVGCSGGPDSMCLLSAIESICKGPIGCLFFDHGIRPKEEIGKERALAESYASALQVSFFFESSGRGVIEQQARARGIGIEAAAREARHRALCYVAEKNSYTYIALGHTQDDQIETVLMRVLAGSGVDGLKGIPETRGKIIRPLIDVTRDSIISYLSERNISFCVDPSNSSSMFLRNVIRNEILPQISAHLPSARTGLLSFAAKMGATASSLDILTDRYIHAERIERGYRFSADDFETLPGLARYRYLLKLWNTLPTEQDADARIPYRFFSPIISENLSADSEATILRGYGAVLAKSAKLYTLQTELVQSPIYNYLFNVAPGNCYSVGGLSVSISTSELGSDRHEILRVSESSLSLPVVLRNRRDGDEICLESGTKTVKKLLNEWRVPTEKRWTLPIIEDRMGLVAVLEGKAGGRVALRSGISPKGASFEDGTVWVLSLSNTEINSEHAR